MTATAGVPHGRVPGYLGRVLDDIGDPVGTCFQVAPGALVTAGHVLDYIGAAADDPCVLVDPLAGGDRFQASVVRVDPLRDLAVLTCDVRLPAVAGPLTATDRMVMRTPVTATGHAVLEDWGSTYRFLTAPGEWAGGITRDDAVPLGRMTSSSVMPGMSGAPVIRDSDGAVAGVVSGRYNSADGWLQGTVWVARTEDLAALLDGITSVTMQQVPPSEPVDVVLAVTGGQVRLTGGGIDVSADHGGVRPSMVETVDETRRSRLSLPARSQAEAPASAGELLLSRAGRLLGESFLPGPIRGELGKVLAAAEREHQPVRIGLAMPPELAGLPWEALPSPDGRGPLALHPLISLYRKSEAVAVRLLPGPLRIVVAIAAPDAGGGAVVDYDRELRNVLAAVRGARQDAADVRVVPFATISAIRQELDRGPAHVLHVCGHGSPGILNLENDDGSARPVTADDFANQAVPPGRMPPVVVLSGRYTDAAGSQGGVSFAARLCQRGAAAVIATDTSVTDTCATRLLARVYGVLARPRDPGVLTALSDARRQVQAELETSPAARDGELAALGEWAAVTILAAAGSVPVLDPERTARAVPQPSRPRIAGLVGRDDRYFVGRRPERRHWAANLTGPALAGIVVHGIGGVGKTMLAAEIAARVRDREPGRMLVSLTGPLTLEGLLGAVISAARRELLVRGHDDAAIQALDVAGRADLPWRDRLGILRDHVLDHLPVLLLLDNFEENLRPGSDARYMVGDEVLAGLLAAWAADPGRSRLLVTCRYRFALPGGAERALSFRQLGALSRAETMKLAWSLPALDRLDEGQLEHVWRLAGGHPRSLEYLDALLSGGEARYPDVTARLSAAISCRLSGVGRGRWLAARAGLDAALAETVALAADDVLLDNLLARLAEVPGAAELLLGVSVYREPVDSNAVLFQARQPDPDAEDIPGRETASRQIANTLAAAGITEDEAFDLATVPGHVRAQLAPPIAELPGPSVPPHRSGPGMPGQIAACQATSLLTIGEDGGEPRFFVHQWTATELAGRAARQADQQLAGAHRRAAGYWRWRVRVWPQDRAAGVHDLLEARHHLLQAGDIEDASQVTEWACGQLHTWGAWDQEASLIHDTLARLSGDSPRQAAWIHQLGVLAYARGDYSEAARQYQRALGVFERLGDQAGMAVVCYRLGVLAYAGGDCDEAARQYQGAVGIDERLGDQAGLATSYSQLGDLEKERDGLSPRPPGLYDSRLLTIEDRPPDQRVSSDHHSRVFILASVKMYREGLTQCLGRTGSISVVGESADPASALTAITDIRPDVVLLDLGMDDGPRVACKIRDDLPGTRVVALAVSGLSSDVISWAQAGISAFVTQDQTLSELVATVLRTSQGEVVCPQTVVAGLLDGLAAKARERAPAMTDLHGRLTAREEQIAALMEAGMSNKEIGRVLSISLSTVKNHVHSVLCKLGVEHRFQAGRKFRSLGDLPR